MTFDAPNHDATYEHNTDLGRQADVAGDVLLDTPPSTWGDMIGLASIVAHEAGHDLDALGERPTNDGDPGPKAAEMLALAVFQLPASAVPQLISADPELVRLISAWRHQRDIIDRTAVETAGILTFEESKPSEEIIGKASSVACDLARQIWERAKAETWSGERSTRSRLPFWPRSSFTTRTAHQIRWSIPRSITWTKGVRRAYGRRAFLRSQRWRRVRPSPHGRPLLASCSA